MTNRSAPPNYRHFKPKNLAVVRIDGHDHCLGKFGSPECWEKYHLLLASRALPVKPAATVESIQPPASDPTVNEMLLAFWRHAEGHYRHPDGSPSEELGNLKAALRPVRLLFGLSPAKCFGPLSLRSVRQQMIGDGLARTSINDRINRVRRAFKWAAFVELIPVSVVSALATVAELQRAGRRRGSPTRCNLSRSIVWRPPCRISPRTWRGWSDS
jgi:hypothetical protein